MRTAILLLTLAPAAARADIATWFWTIDDTGNHDGIIEPGEAAILSHWLSFDPPNNGFSEAGPYALSGDARWAGGTVGDFENLLALGSDGVLDETTNTVTGIEHFQLPRAFDVYFHTENPIELYRIHWEPDHSFVGEVRIQSDAPDAWIYIDDWGERILYEGTGGIGVFRVVPSPAPAALAFAALGWAARRRR